MTEAVALVLALIPLLGAWATLKFYSWYRFYGTRFLWGLFLASTSSSFASMGPAYLSVRRLIVGPDAPPFPEAVLILGTSLVILEGAFVYLVLRWKDLDNDMKRVRLGEEDESSHTNLPPRESRDVERETR